MDHPATTKPYQGLLIAALCSGAVGATLLGLTEINIDQLGAGAGSVALTLGWIALTMWLWTGVFISAHTPCMDWCCRKSRTEPQVGQICLGIYAIATTTACSKPIMHHRHPSEPEDPDYWYQHGPQRCTMRLSRRMVLVYAELFRLEISDVAVFEGLHALAGIENPCC